MLETIARPALGASLGSGHSLSRAPLHPPVFLLYRHRRAPPSCASSALTAATLLSAGLDASVIDPPELLPAALQQVAHVPEPVAAALRVTLTTAAAYVAAAWPTRPRGWYQKDLLEVRQSLVEGRGLFATADIPRGTVLGQYPGRPRSADAMLAKFQTAPLAREYCFRTRTDTLLDPTDAQGRPACMPAPGLPWLPVDVALCYANEPPAGSAGVNAAPEDDPNDIGILFVACRDIAAGAEILVDYGSAYDRSGYGA